MRHASSPDNADDLIVEKWLTDESANEILLDGLLDAHIILIKITGNHHYSRGRVQLVNLLSQLQPVYVRQFSIQKCQGVFILADEVESVVATESKSGMESRGFQNVLQGPTHVGFIIDD